MKSQRVYQFLVVLLLMLPVRIFCQQQLPRIAQNSPHPLSFSENFQKQFFRSTLGYGKIETTSGVLFQDINYRYTGRTYNFAEPLTAIIPGCYSQLGFFCRKEFQFEKNTSIPLRLRLGSLEYVNNMEGKK